MFALFVTVLLVGGALVAAFCLGRYVEGRDVKDALDDMEPALAKLEAEWRVQVKCSTCRCVAPDRQEALRQGWEVDSPRCFGCIAEEKGPSS